MSISRKLTVLASVFAFSPVKGSEFASVSDCLRAIAENHHVRVIARDFEREETERFLRQHPEVMPGLVVHYVPWTIMSLPLKLIVSVIQLILYTIITWFALFGKEERGFLLKRFMGSAFPCARRRKMSLDHADSAAW